MFRNRPHRTWTALTAAACAVVLTGLLAADASAHGRKVKRGHRHHGRDHVVVRVVERPVPVWRASFDGWWGDAVPRGCDAGNRVVYDGSPYWYHAGFGVWLGGAHVDVRFGDVPAPGWGYHDPYCGEWFDDVRAYSTHCKRHGHRPLVRVVRFEDRCSGWRW